MMAFGAKIKLSVNKSGASAFRNEIQKYVNEATKANPVKLNNIQLQMTNPKTQLRDIQKKINEAGGITVKLKEVEAKGAISKLRSDIQTMLKGLNIVGLKDFIDTGNIDGVKEEIKQASMEAATFAAQMKIVDNISSKLASTYKTALSGKGMIKSDVATDETKGTTSFSDISADYEKYLEKVNVIKQQGVAASAQEIEALKQQGIQIQRNITLTQEYAANEKRSANEQQKAETSALQMAQKTVSLKGQIQRYILSNTKAYRNYNNELDGFIRALDNPDINDETYRDVKRQFEEVKISARAAGLAGNTFFDTLKKGWEKFGGWSLVTKSMTAAWRIIKDMVTATKELDAAMTELRKVTDLSEASYRKYLNTAKEMSKEVGASLADTVNATADFSRLGYDITEASALAEAALVYKNVGDGIDDIAEASESLISTIKAFEQFGVTAGNAMNIVDKFNEVGNNFAISSEGIGVALQKSASSLAAANNSLEQSIALITAGNAVIQNPEIVGTALKTVSMYLRAAKTEAEEAGESTDGMANSVSELRKELLRLTNNKVDIMIDDTQFKSTYDIFKELSAVWSELSDVDTANILELIGGKRNATAVTSLITNFKDAEAALRTAGTASGSALAENEKYLDSINGKLAIMQSKFESISENVINSGLVKFVLDISSALMSVTDLLTEIHLGLPAIAGSVAIFKGFQEFSKLQEIARTIQAQTGDILKQGEATDQLILSISRLSKSQRDLLKDEVLRIASTDKLGDEQKELLLTTLSLSAAENAGEKANYKYALSLKSITASIPVWGWVAIAASAILELGVFIYEQVSQLETSAEKLTRLKDEFKQIADEMSGISNGYRDLKKSAEDIIPRFAELSKGVNEFGDNVDLTDEEYSEFLSLNNQLAELFPEINMGMDSNGNAMLALSGNADTLTESLWALVEAEQAAANEQIAAKMPEVVTNADEQKTLLQRLVKDAEAERYSYLKEILPHSATLSGNLKSEEDLVAFLKNKYLGFDLSGTSIESELSGTYSIYWNYDNINYDLLDTEYKNYLIGLEKKIEDLKRQEEDVWKILNRPVNAWLQTDWTYSDLNDEMQNIANTLVNGLDFSEIVTSPQTGQSDIQNYITENIITPLFRAEKDIKDAFDKISDMKKDVDLGKITEDEYFEHVASAFGALTEAMDPAAAELFKTMLISAFTESGEAAISWEEAVVKMADAWGKFKDKVTTSSAAAIAKTMVDTVNGISEAHKLLETAQAEMESGGLTTATVKSIVDSMGEKENYLDYLYEENGLIKLNIEAWKERANAKALGDINTLQSEIEALKEENAQKREQISLLEKEFANKSRRPRQETIDQIKELSSEISVNNDKIEENQRLLAVYAPLYESVTGGIADVLDMTEMTSGLSSVSGQITNLVNAMDSLAKGTKLSKQELAKLVLEYPKLLEASNAFTTGSVSGQNQMLENILKVYEAEYDATIDTKIAELEAMNELLRARVDAEQVKTNLILKIKANEANSSVEYQKWLTDRIAEYNFIEGQNFVTSQNGILKVNEEALNDMLKQQGQMTALSEENIWAPHTVAIGSAIANGIAKGGTAALKALDAFSGKVNTKTTQIAKDVDRLFNNPWHAIDESGEAKVIVNPEIVVDQKDLESDIVKKGSLFTIDGQSIDDWAVEQETRAAERIEALKSQVDTNINIINNLKRLKGLDLQSIYGPDSSASSATEKYIADIDAYYAAIKQLEAAQEFRADVERNLNAATDPRERIQFSRDLITAYLDEAEAERNLAEQKKDTIEKNIELLREQGFIVNYNRETNRLYIENLEQLNNIEAESKGHYDDLTAASNALRKEYEELIDVTEELNDDNVETEETVNELAESITEAKESIIEDIAQMTEDARDSLSDVVGVYETLRSAVESYNQNGYLTVDMFQSIMDLGAEYLNFLYDEHGAISFNEEAIRNLMAAKIEDLAVTRAMSLVDTIKEHRENAEVLREMADATYDATNATWGLVYAELASLNLDPDLYNAFYQQINKIRQLLEAARLGMESAYNMLGSDAGMGGGAMQKYYDEAKDALDYILDKTQELIKYEVEQQVDAIKKQVDAYKELVDLKKESLEKTKEEDDYEEAIADKVKDIAELQAKIDQLSLDNSRQAQAERNALLSELADKQKDLADTQEDHIYDNQVDALDKLSKDYEDNRQQEIDILEGCIDSAEKLYQSAIQRIQFNWDGLFYSLMNWNTVAGNDINANITENWNKATDAVRNYGSYLQAVAAVKAGAEQASSSNGNTIGFIGNAFPGLPIYHDGGVVGGKHDKEEVVALLEAGEIVLDDKKQDALYEAIDFKEELSKRLGAAVRSIDLSSASLRISSIFGDIPFRNADNSTRVNFEPHIDVHIEGGGRGDDEEAKSFGQKIADVAMEKLYGAFERKGLTGFKSGVLKPQ